MTAPKTIVEAFFRQTEGIGDQQALFERQGDGWASFSWNQWCKRSRAVAAALIADGISPDDGVAIFSYSRREWVEADMGVLMAGARTVTIYHNLKPDTVHYILNDAQAVIVFAEGPLQLKSLFGEQDGGLPAAVKRVVYFTERQTPQPRPGQPDPKEISLQEVVPAGMRDKLEPFEAFIDRGLAKLEAEPGLLDARLGAIDPDGVAKIIYTSGTTGTPKGAMLTHANFIFTVDSVQQGLGLSNSDTTLLFLPLAHVYAQLTYHAAIKVGFGIAFARSMLTAVDDAESIGPSFFTTVPRLYEKIHAAAVAKIEEAGGLKKKIFYWATDVGAKVIQARLAGRPVDPLLGIQHRIADKLIFSKLKARLGGRIRFMISGGAPLPYHILEFFHAADLPILEGYGMTENASLSHYNRVGNFKPGTVGEAIPGVAVKIADDGEILVRGPNVMKGYLGMPEATAEVIDRSDWLHTGDIGKEDAEGFLTITDRKKAIIVTSGGKNIPPAPIENALTASQFVSQALVFGDRRKYLVALLTLDKEFTLSWAKERGIDHTRYEKLLKDERLNQALNAEIDAVNANQDTFSSIKAFVVLPRDLSIEEGEITPTLKLKRRVIEKKYADLLDGLYPKEPGR